MARRLGTARRWTTAVAPLLCFATLCFGTLAACSTPQTPDDVPVTGTTQPVLAGPVRTFEFELLDGTRIDHRSLRGRMTLVAFLATYDTASQAQARFLKAALLRHVPRINVLAIVLEPEHHRPLVDAFRSSLELPYLVALADRDTIAGRGPFEGLHHVPSVVLLDRDGHERWRHLGIIETVALRKAIAAHDSRAR